MSATASTRTLPLDVVEEIIDHCHNDETTLSNCTLVCADWIPGARYHLISKVKLRRGIVDQFLLALTTPGSKLGPSIQSLVISSISLTIPPYQLNRAIPLLADHLPSVKSLFLAGLDWRTLDTSAQTRFLHAFPQLLELEIVLCHFRTLGQLTDFISSFSDLDYLSVNKPQWDERTARLPLLKPLPPRLKKLLLYPAECAIVNFFISHPCRYLEKISLDDVTKEQIPAVRDLLCHAGPSLHELRIRFTDNIRVKNVFNADVDLSHNTQLRTLTLVITLLSFDPPGYRAYFLDWIPAFLAKVNSAHLEVVTFQLLTLDPTQFDPNWRELDRIFASPAYLNLKKIHFSIAHPPMFTIPVEDPRDVIEQLELLTFHNMPKTSRRDGLTIDTTFTMP